MTLLQPVLALALAVLCALISGVPPDGKRFRSLNPWAVGAYVLILVASAFCAVKLGHIDDRRAVFLNLLVGGVVALACAILSDLSVGVPIALATAGACAAHLIRADSFAEVGLAYAFSVSMAGVFFGGHRGVIVAGLVGGLVAFTDCMGKSDGGGPNRQMIGVAMGIALSVAAIAALVLTKAIPKAIGRLRPTLVAVLGAGAGYAVSKYAVGGDLWIILGIAAVSALVVHWLVPAEGDPAAFRVGVAMVIWLSLSTIAFSLMRGFGMAPAVLEGVAVLALLGNGRAILTLGPAIGLVMYRLLRDASPDSSKALDIGQHYGVTGIVVGAVIPVLFADWYLSKRSERAWGQGLTSLFWAFILICLPVLSIVVLGAKGASGVVVGLGLSGLLIAYRAGKDTPVMTVAIAAGAANAVAVDWIGETMQLTRQDKLHSFGWWALATAVAAAGILIVSRQKKVQGVA